MADSLNNDIYQVDYTVQNRYMTFYLDGEIYGIDIRHVREIIGIQPSVQLPDMPIYMKGIINLRGRIIPLLDVRIRFGKCENDYNDRTCIIVVELKGSMAGLIVDGVNEVIEFNEESIHDADEIAALSENLFVNKIGTTDQGICLLVDCDALT